MPDINTAISDCFFMWKTGERCQNELGSVILLGLWPSFLSKIYLKVYTIFLQHLNTISMLFK